LIKNHLKHFRINLVQIRLFHFQLGQLSLKLKPAWNLRLTIQLSKEGTSKSKLRLLVDMSFLLPAMGIETEKEAMEAIKCL